MSAAPVTVPARAFPPDNCRGGQAPVPALLGAESVRVLIGCEFSGTVRDAFLERGFDAWSCDLLPDEKGSNRHIKGDVRDVIREGWDVLIVAHPPCTRLCNSGVRWLRSPPPGRTLDDMWRDLDDAAALFSDLWLAPVRHVAIENPVMHGHAKARIVAYEPPAQSVQPWQFGHGESKRTCLWLRNLPRLVPTEIVTGREQRVHRMPPGPERWRERSRFFPGIARAMAAQWGAHVLASFHDSSRHLAKGPPAVTHDLFTSIAGTTGLRGEG